MKTIKRKVTQELCDEIERAQYEVNSRQGVIDRYMEKHAKDADFSAIDSKPFQHFMSQLSYAEAELEMAKAEVTNTYVPEVLKSHNIQWNLDFASQELTIDVLCDCEIEGL